MTGVALVTGSDAFRLPLVTLHLSSFLLFLRFRLPRPPQGPVTLVESSGFRLLGEPDTSRLRFAVSTVIGGEARADIAYDFDKSPPVLCVVDTVASVICLEDESNSSQTLTGSLVTSFSDVSLPGSDGTPTTVVVERLWLDSGVIRSLPPTLPSAGALLDFDAGIDAGGSAIRFRGRLAGSVEIEGAPTIV